MLYRVCEVLKDNPNRTHGPSFSNFLLEGKTRGQNDLSQHVHYSQVLLYFSSLLQQLTASFGFIVRLIDAFIMQNRSLNDKSTKFGTEVEDTIRKSFGYRAIADLPFDPKWLTNAITIIVCQPFWVKGQISEGPITKIPSYGILYLFAKFHAFIIK